jgi:hypothetical protein
VVLKCVGSPSCNENTAPIGDVLLLRVAPSAAEEFDRLLKIQERESRVIASLTTKMRLTQQATTNHRGNKIEPKKPWEF